MIGIAGLSPKYGYEFSLTQNRGVVKQFDFICFIFFVISINGEFRVFYFASDN